MREMEIKKGEGCELNVYIVEITSNQILPGKN